jgi:isochorismate synthase
MNFGQIYNPNTFEISKFIESVDINFDVRIENFEGSQSLKYKFVDDIPKFFKLQNSNLTSTKKSQYIEWVECIKQQITNQKIIKAVAAQIQVETEDNQNCLFEDLFQKLVRAFPQTFVYQLFIDGAIWIGASPETIGIQKDEKFRTISLAGTQLHSNKFGAKEENEQKIVSNIISNQLGIDSGFISKSSIYQFGEIEHLITEYDLAIDEKFNFEQMIHNIHPSPAICGYPKDESKALILDLEPIEREIYTGLVTISIQPREKYSFAILRCVKYSANQKVFFAGAGITSGSDPESEWFETLQKMHVIKSCLQSN